MRLHVELDREADGRWVGEIPSLPGAMAHGRTRAEAIAVAQALALRILVERWVHQGSAAH
jgi:predicted RNase H-like HicB family nuclease